MVIQKDKVIILIAFLGALAVGIYQLNSDSVDSPNPAPLKPSQAGEFRGIALQLHSSSPTRKYADRIDEIAATGANTLSLIVHGYQENCSSSSIFIDARKIPPRRRIKDLIAHAHKRSLRVVLMPVVLLTKPRDEEWRGTLKPTSWDDWWTDYNAFVLHWAKLAQECDVELFMVGSELVSTEAQSDRWRLLIAQVRKAFTTGRLSYSANWDHYMTPAWWGDLDIIGMTTYHDLTGGKSPTLENLLAGWAPIKKKILAWRRTVNRPIIFTEVGWPNQPTCAQYPWNYYQSDTTDPAAQGRCFEAFFRTWMQEKCVAGMLVWEWKTYENENVDPKTDRSYVPCGKPAMGIIRKHFQVASPNAPVASPNAPTAK